MPTLLILIYFVICTAMLVWGLREKSRYFQYPTVIGATWLFVLGPLVINAAVRPDKYPPGVMHDHGLEIAMSMCILCMLAGWVGYTIRPRRAISGAAQWSEKRILISGLLLYVIGIVFAAKMMLYVGGFKEYFLGGGYYVAQWSGALVRYKFFAKLVYLGLTFTLFATLMRTTFARLVLCGVFLVYPFCVIVFLGDRSDTAAILFAGAMPLFFIRRWAPPRVAVLTVIVLAGAACFLWPQYRELTSTGRFDELRQVKAGELVYDRFTGTNYSEFDVMVVIGAAINKELNMGLGTGIYNSLVGNFVPAQIIGQQAKKSLLLTPPLIGQTSYELYGWAIPYGSTATGPASVFAEFWFFGCLLYFGVGRLYRRLWEAARIPDNYGFQILYATVVWTIPYLVIVCFNTFLATLLYIFVFIYPFLFYIGKKKCGLPVAPGLTTGTRSPTLFPKKEMVIILPKTWTTG
jgi:hypothetical protein